jgi:hypothetical protein
MGSYMRSNPHSGNKSWSVLLVFCIWCRGMRSWFAFGVVGCGLGGMGNRRVFGFEIVHLLGVPDEDAVRGDAEEIKELSRPCNTV